MSSHGFQKETKLNNIDIEYLIELFSKSRIDPYLNPGDKAETLLAKYHSNIILSEAMTPTLNYLEICLRNRIDNVIQKYFGTNWLINYTTINLG